MRFFPILLLLFLVISASSLFPQQIKTIDITDNDPIDDKKIETAVL